MEASAMTPHTAALRWVAGQLAWEDRLGALRDDPETDALTETTADESDGAASVELLVTATTPCRRSRGRAA
jgi:hypothetical protein